jgi:hypothetical protein|tara:strand:- start:1734 stop:2051 length:318 start_codon:yes stop_codon:yes gene_type:complete
MATKIKWEEADFKWEKAPASGTPYLWNEVLLIEEIISENTSGIEKAVEELEPEKKKRLVHLILKRKGIKIYDKAKEVKDVKIDIKDVELIIKEVRAQIEAENIHV